MFIPSLLERLLKTIAQQYQHSRILGELKGCGGGVRLEERTGYRRRVART